MPGSAVGASGGARALHGLPGGRVAHPGRPGYDSRTMSTPFDARRRLLGVAKNYLLDAPKTESAPMDPPRLTFAALERIPMSRSRDRILANLEEMYKEAFQKAKAAEDEAQMATLDFAYRREQLYFEILLDVRDAVERRG